MHYFLRLTSICLISAGASLFAQEEPVLPDTPDAAITLPAPSLLAPVPATPDSSLPYTPLDLKQKYLYSVNQTFTLPKMAIMSIRAGLDHYNHTPNQWTSEPEGYGMRFASHLGRSLVREQLAFGVRAIDHEDPRYFRLGRGTIMARTKYAASRTFIARNDNGSWMPAYSRFIASYGMPLIARQWRPEPIHTMPDALKAGSMGIGLGMATNICQEFLPDLKTLKNRFHH